MSLRLSDHSPLFLAAFLVWIGWPFPGVGAERLEPLASVNIRGDVAEDKDVSGVGLIGEDRMVLVADEGSAVQVLRRVSPDVFEVQHTVSLLERNDEADLEAIAIDGHTVYALGSHSAIRRRPTNKKGRGANLERFYEIAAEPSRDLLVRLVLSPEGEARVDPMRVSLRKMLSRHALLRPFQKLPSKENGIDLEGLGYFEDHLLVGFRGPVLRGNYVPVLRFKFDQPNRVDVRFVTLGGRGIRGMTAVDGGVLLLAGPVGDGEASYDVHFWDGIDCFPGEGTELCVLAKLGTLSGLPSPKAKPEGITLLEESEQAYEVLIVFDSARNGAPQRYSIPKADAE